MWHRSGHDNSFDGLRLLLESYVECCFNSGHAYPVSGAARNAPEGVG